MAATAVPRTRRTWDVVLTVVLLVVLVGETALVPVGGLLLTMASDPCGAAVRCDEGRIGAGVLVAVLGPVAAGTAGLVGSVVLLARRRLAFWVPITAGVLVPALWVLGAVLAVSGVPGATL